MGHSRKAGSTRDESGASPAHLTKDHFGVTNLGD